MDSGILDAIERHWWAGISIAAVIVAVAFYRFIAPAWGRHLRTKQAEGAARAVTELNGRLIDAITKALRPIIVDTVKEVFREMPEFIRDRIKDLGGHGANNAIMLWEDKHSVLGRIASLETWKGSMDSWRSEHDKDADLRENRIHAMELTLVRMDEVLKGQEVLQGMLSDLKEVMTQSGRRR